MYVGPPLVSNLITGLLIMMLWILTSPANCSSRAASGPPLSAPLTSSRRGSCEETERSIPFELYGNHVIVQVGVQGSRPLSFILDTGADISLLNDGWATELGLKIVEQHEERVGTGENTIKIGFAENVGFSLDGIEIPTKVIAVAPLRITEAQVGRTVDGVLGADIFNRYTVEIDFAAREITLHDPGGYLPPHTGETLPVKLTGGRPFVKARIATPGSSPIECLLVIDTGDSSGLSLHTPFVERYHLLSSLRKSLQNSTSGLGGEAKEVLGRVETLELGRVKIKQPVTAFAQAARGSTADPGYDGAIGVEILRRFRVTFDYSRQQITLEPNKAFGEAYEADMSGAALTAEGQDFRTFRVVHIAEASPAAYAGLRAGDVITSVDGRPAADLNLAEVRRLFKRRGQAYTLGVKRGGQTLRIKLKMKRLV